MEPDILTFIIVDLNGNFRLGLAFGHFDRGPNNVILPPWRHALREFATIIGRELPFRLLVSRAPNGDGYTRHWTIIRTPNRPEDQCVVSHCLVLLRARFGTKAKCK